MTQDELIEKCLKRIDQKIIRELVKPFVNDIKPYAASRYTRVAQRQLEEDKKAIPIIIEDFLSQVDVQR